MPPSESALLRTLRSFFVRILGINAHEARFRLDDNWHDWFLTLDDDLRRDIDMADIYWRMQREFGLSAPQEEFFAFLNGGGPNASDDWETSVKPSLTFRALVRWIQERIHSPCFDPIDICGLESSDAGAFWGIIAVADSVSPPARRISPSTRLYDRVRGMKAHDFWQRMQVHSNGKLPPLWFPAKAVGYTLMICALVSVIASPILISIVCRTMQVEFGLWRWLVILPAAIATGLALLLIGVWLLHSGNPFPPEIQTFRELAHVVANRRRIHAERKP